MELLLQKADCNIYWAKFGFGKELIIYIINNKDYSDKTKIGKITDNTKHSIVLFEGYKTEQSNDYIYTQFNIMASKVLLDLQALDANNELPRVNLIGHSRGGLTNLQYALDHPDLVDSIFSLGTPYLGSTTASIDKHVLGGMVSGCAGEDDIVNPNIYLGYLNRWNTQFDNLYSNINVHALGGYQSLDLLVYQLIYPFMEKALDIDIIDGVAKPLLKSLNVYLSLKLVSFENHIPVVLVQELISGILNIVYRAIPQIEYDDGVSNGLKAILEIVFDELQFNPLALSYDFMNDGLVDLPSQLGMDGQSSNAYKGFNRHVKRFSIFGNYNLKKASVNNLRATHNLEARDTELLAYIVKNIYMSNNKNGSPFLVINDKTNYNTDGVSIIGYIGKNVNGTLTIPNEIYFNGSLKEVVSIGDNAFANNMNDEMGITEVVIPDTVEIIGRGAFSNNENINSIVLGSGVKEILEGAFAYMPKLNRLDIPNGIKLIEDRAFEQSNISVISISSNLYSWESNLLINKNVTDASNRIAIYANPTVSSITIPNGVKTLSAYLFYGNKTLTDINLNQTKYIGESAFAYSNIKNINNHSSIIDAGIESFISTPWLKKQTSDVVKIGKVLLSYNGNVGQAALEQQLIDIVRIGEYAFSSTNVQSIVLPASIGSIGKNAFTECKNLRWILFNSTNPPILDGDCFGSDVQLYVKLTALTAYQESIFYNELPNAINAKNIEINFYSEDGQFLGSRREEYYSTFDQMVVPPNVEGHEFSYWSDNSGVSLYEYDIFSFCSDVDLYANYKLDEYNITFQSDSGSETISIQYGDYIYVASPVKQGYTFMGWYDSKTAGNLIIDINGECVWQKMSSVKSLYALFSANVYTIYYSTSMGTFQDAKPLTFTVEKPITPNEIPVIKEFGYVFEGWYKDGLTFSTTYGIYNNITLTAKWLGIKMAFTNSTTITINNEYSIVYMKDASISGTYRYSIASNVKYVTFIGNTSKTFANMRITVNSRNTALVMGFSNMSFYPTKNTTGIGYDAIYAPNGCELYISYQGTNIIAGGCGADGTSYYSTPSQALNNYSGYSGSAGGNGYNGGNAINAWKVNLTQFDVNSSIKMVGGNGGNGGLGGRGQKGSNGVRSPYGSFVAPMKGDDGAYGGSGGRGGNGGNGGYAIKVYSNTFLKTTSATNYFLFGGVGGMSGNGGTGGADTSWWFCEPGAGGQGGNGGNGGDAGFGGAALSCTTHNISPEFLVDHNTEQSLGGSYGGCGAGGDGGIAGASGNPGATGLEGEKDGADGKSGTYGYNEYVDELFGVI